MTERGNNRLAGSRLVLLAAVPLFLVLALVAYLTLQFAANERDAQGWVRHTYQVMEAQRRLQDDVQTAETGMRGLSAEPRSGLPAPIALPGAAVPGDLALSASLTTDNPAQQARADRLENLFRRASAGFECGRRGGHAEPVSRPQAMAGPGARPRADGRDPRAK